MRKSFMILLIINFLTQLSIAQTSDSFMFSGNLRNCTTKHLLIHYEDDDYRQFVDTIYINDSGVFKFVIDTLKKNQTVRISGKVWMPNIFIAPGYKLYVTGDATDFRTLNTTKKITGIGAEHNQYYVLLDSMIYSHEEDTFYVYKKYAGALTFIENQFILRDSLINVVFNKKHFKNDSVSVFLKETINIENEMNKMSQLFSYFSINGFTIEKQHEIITENFSKQFLDNMSDEINLTSASFKSFLVSYYYIKYLTELEELNKEVSQNDKSFFDKTDRYYNDKVRDYADFSIIYNYMSGASEWESFSRNKKLILNHIPRLENKFYQESIKRLISRKETALLKTINGSKAPAIHLKDVNGNIHKLEDYKGKVIYLDFWATWCGPCIKETPYLTDLYEKYKDEEDFLIISICVNDYRDKWEKYLEKENQEWLNLIDEKDIMKETYMTHSIPKFTLINKKGEIAEFNAPRPSSEDVIEELINKELSK